MSEEIIKILTDKTSETVSIEFNMKTGVEVPQKMIKELWKEFFGKAPFPPKPIKVFTLGRREYQRLVNQYMALYPQEPGWIDFADFMEYGEPQDTLKSRSMGICFNFSTEYSIFIDREAPESFRSILKHELAHIKNEDWQKDEEAWDALKKAA